MLSLVLFGAYTSTETDGECVRGVSGLDVTAVSLVAGVGMEASVEWVGSDNSVDSRMVGI